MPLINYVKTTTNKQLLISESHDNLKRCTPCRGKSDTHDTYASHVSSRAWQPFASHQQRRTDHTAPKKKGS
jgi:hypothetical protein